MGKSKTRKKQNRPTNEQRRRQGAQARQATRNLESYGQMLDAIEAAEAEYAAQNGIEITKIEDPTAEAFEEQVSETVSFHHQYQIPNLAGDIPETTVPLVHYLDGERLVIGEAKVSVESNGMVHAAATVTDATYFTNNLKSNTGFDYNTYFTTEGEVLPREMAVSPSFLPDPISATEFMNEEN